MAAIPTYPSYNPCPRCQYRYMCSTDSTCNVWWDELYTDTTGEEPKVARKEKPQIHIHWEHQERRAVHRDSRRFIRSIAPRRLQRGRNS